MKLEGREQDVLLDFRALQLNNLRAITKPRFKKKRKKKDNQKPSLSHKGVLDMIKQRNYTYGISRYTKSH